MAAADAKVSRRQATGKIVSARRGSNQATDQRKAHTEMAFTGKYVNNHQDGFYRCAGCGAKLFSSDAKFNSRTGWPSFDQPAVAEAVELRPDNSLFMRRTEVVCRRCGGHLGHVFNDGPKTTGKRYCINSCSLAFEPATASQEQADS